MFSILNSYMLRPAPYPGRDRLERIYRAVPQDPLGGFSPADYLDLKPAANGYGEIATYAYSDISLSESGKPAEMAWPPHLANLFFHPRRPTQLVATSFQRKRSRGTIASLIISRALLAGSLRGRRSCHRPRRSRRWQSYDIVA